VLSRPRIEHDASPEGVRRRDLAHDQPIAAGRQQRAF
jgi:hypothetical protein